MAPLSPSRKPKIARHYSLQVSRGSQLARSSIDIRRARRVPCRVSLFVTSVVARRHTKEPQAHYALGASIRGLGGWGVGGQGNRPASPNARCVIDESQILVARRAGPRCRLDPATTCSSSSMPLRSDRRCDAKLGKSPPTGAASNDPTRKAVRVGSLRLTRKFAQTG
jgi:hypothetical protein